MLHGGSGTVWATLRLIVRRWVPAEVGLSTDGTSFDGRPQLASHSQACRRACPRATAAART